MRFFTIKMNSLIDLCWDAGYYNKRHVCMLRWDPKTGMMRVRFSAMLAARAHRRHGRLSRGRRLRRIRVLAARRKQREKQAALASLEIVEDRRGA
jgi:hypothetical protein